MPWEWNPSDTHLVKKLQIHRGNETYTQCEWNTQIHSRKTKPQTNQAKKPQVHTGKTTTKQQQQQTKQKQKNTLKDTVGKETPGVQQ